MPTKDDPRITVRLSQGQYDTYVRLAKLRGLSLSAFVRELLSTVHVSYPILKGKPLNCPVPSCDYGAYSPKARCPHHNRLVV